MSLEISVPDVLADRLRLRAEAEHVSVEELARRILQRGLEPPLAAEQWNAVNRRRVQLIEKRFSVGLSADEEQQLRQLQEMADRQLEKLDERLIDDLAQMERSAADALKE
jgi:plasmid stability protein